MTVPPDQGGGFCFVVLSFLKTHSTNFTTLVQTPWAGPLIAARKRRMVGAHASSGAIPDPIHEPIPERIGESWEVSTDASHPSRVTHRQSRGGDRSARDVGPGNQETDLREVLSRAGAEFIGAEIARRFPGGHCPLLLKWLNARENLSVQVHPTNGHPLLGERECGKPEAWLVLEALPDAVVYLGLKDGAPRDADSLARLVAGGADPREYMHVVRPRRLDYISVPPGCLHAVGPGVLLAEPQLVLPGRSGKTFRLSDWNRRYDESGQPSPNGKPRALHVAQALESLDPSLPQGVELERRLVRSLAKEKEFLGDSYNPFAVACHEGAGEKPFRPPFPGQMTLFSVVSGEVRFLAENDRPAPGMTGKSPSADAPGTAVCSGGESGIIGAESNITRLSLRPSGGEEPFVIFFSLNLEGIERWLS